MQLLMGYADTVRILILGGKNPLRHREIELVPGVCWSDGLPTELHPHPIPDFCGSFSEKSCRKGETQSYFLCSFLSD